MKLSLRSRRTRRVFKEKWRIRRQSTPTVSQPMILKPIPQVPAH